MTTSTSLSTQTITSLLSFPFRGEGWQKKLLVAGLLSLAGMFTLGIASLFVLGYIARLMRTMIHAGDEAHLPEWDAWGELFLDGLKIAAAIFIYTLPVLLLFTGGYIFMLLPSVLGAASSSEEVLGVAFMLSFGAYWLLFGLSMLLSMLLWFILPPAIAHLVDRQSFTAAFSPRRWFPILRRNLGGFIVAYLLLTGLLGMVYMAYTLLIFTFVLCFLAPLILLLLSVYILLAGAALVAQAYRDGKSRLEAA
jgi:hypothetical protein